MQRRVGDPPVKLRPVEGAFEGDALAYLISIYKDPAMPGGGNTLVLPRSNSALICSPARRTVAVDATIFGRMRTDHAGGQLVDGVLLEAGDGAERQLVLDDQIGGSSFQPLSRGRPSRLASLAP